MSLESQDNLCKCVLWLFLLCAMATCIMQFLLALTEWCLHLHVNGHNLSGSIVGCRLPIAHQVCLCAAVGSSAVSVYDVRPCCADNRMWLGQ